MLQHVTLEVRPDQVGDCIGFWRLLGFKPMDRPPELPPTSAWVERRGTQIHLLQVETPTVAAEGHAAVLVVDYQAAIAALQQAGFETRPGLDAWGPRSFVREPAGHLVEVMSAPPEPPWPEAAGEDAARRGKRRQPRKSVRDAGRPSNTQSHAM